MKTKLKRSFAILTIFAMLMSFMSPIHAMGKFGAIGTPGDDKVKLSFQFLGVATVTGSGEDLTLSDPAATEQEVPDLNEGDVIWLGIRVENMTKTAWPALADSGLTSLKMGVYYDPEYIEPLNDGNGEQYAVAVDACAEKYWNASTATTNARKYSTSAELGEYQATGSEDVQLDAGIANMEVLVLDATIGSDKNTRAYQRFYDSTDTSEKTLFEIPMQIKKDSAAGGRKILDLGFAPELFMYTFVANEAGDTNNTYNGGWENVTGTAIQAPTANAKNYMYYTGAPVLMPATYTIAYDNNAPMGTEVTGGPGTNTQSVKEGSSVAADYATGVAPDKVPGKLLDGPKANGFIFTGWYTESGATNKFEATTELTEDFIKDHADEDNTITLYAGWAEGYKITFNGNGGTFAAGTETEFEFVKDAAVDASKFPASSTLTAPEGYVFDSWNSKQNGADGGVKIVDAKTHSYTANESLDLYAQWKPADEENAVTVTFDSNNGDGDTDASPDEKTINSGDSIGADNMPTEPTKEGYKFKEWNTKQNGTGDTFDGTTKVTEDITVYAQWETDDTDDKKDVTVTFNENGGDSEADPKTITINIGDAIGKGNMPDVPTKTGQVFDKWTVATSAESAVFDGDTVLNDSFITANGTVDGDGNATITVYAQYKAEIDVVFMNNDGTDTVAKTLKGYGVDDVIPAADYPADPSRTGYTFWGWNTQDNGGGVTAKKGEWAVPQPKTGETKVTLYGYWQAAEKPEDPDNPDPEPTPNPNAITVTFKANHEDATVAPAKRYLPDGVTKLAANEFATATRENYTLVEDNEWNTQADGKGTTVTTATDLTELDEYDEDTKSITLYAQWEVSDDYDGTSYTLKFYKRNVDTTPYAEYTVAEGDKLGFTPDAPDRAGFTFDGWKDANEVGTTGRGAAFDADTAVTADAEYFGTWSASAIAIPDLPTNNVYTGNPIGVTLNRIILDQEDEEAAEVVLYTADDLTEGEDNDYYFTYGEDEEGDPNPEVPTDAGSYALEFVLLLDGELNGDNIDILSTEPGMLTIEKAPLSFELATARTTDSDPQVIRTSDTDTGYTLDLVAKDPAGNTVANTEYGIAYHAWPKGESIDETVLGSATGHNRYIAVVSIKNSNYKVDEGTNMGTGDKEVKIYADSDFGDTVPDEYKLPTSRIKFEVAPETSIDGVKIAKSDAADFSEPYKLYPSAETVGNTDSAVEFDKETKTYYVRVPADDDIKLEVVGQALTDENRTVTIATNDGEATTVTGTVSEDTNTWTSDAVKPGDVDTSKNGGFNNVITVTVGDDTYTIYVQKLVKPTITLNRGNSPYAEIEKMGLKSENAWSAEDITTAKEYFDTNRRYAAAKVPDGRSTDDRYTLNAWVDPNNANAVAVPAGTDLVAWALEEDNVGKIAYVDYDKDVNALFAYLGTDTPDPGFTVTDSLGNAVTLTAGDEETGAGKVAVKRTIGYDVMNVSGIAGFSNVTAVADTDENNKLNAELTAADSTLAFKDLGLRLRPGRYTIKYTFTDSYGGTVEVERPLVFLARLGDVDMNTLIQTADSAIINKNTVTPVPNENMPGLEVPGRVHKYRVSDVDKNTLIQTADSAIINKNTTKAVKLLYNDLSKTYE